MVEPTRKPLAPPMESRDPKSIRYNPSEWAALSEAARQRGLEVSAFVRDLSMMALMIVSTPGLMEAHLRALAVLRGPGHGISA
jgi:hypothetical protein